MVRVLAIRPKIRGFKTGRGDGHKSPQHTFLRRGNKAGDPMSYDFYGIYKYEQIYYGD
jgi:hypothetical protein